MICQAQVTPLAHLAGGRHAPIAPVKRPSERQQRATASCWLVASSLTRGTGSPGLKAPGLGLRASGTPAARLWGAGDIRPPLWRPSARCYCPSSVARSVVGPEQVFVMAEDAAVRANRLALLRRVAALPDGVLDLGELPGF